MILKKLIELPRDPHGGCRIPEIGRSHLHRAGSRDQKFGRVHPVRDPAHPDHRNLDRLRRFVNHPQRDGLDGRPGKPSESRANAGTPRFSVDRQSHKRVHQRNRIRAGALGRLRQWLDLRDIRRKLHDQRPCGDSPHSAHHFGEQSAIVRKEHPAVLRIWAGYVQFIPVDAFRAFENAGHFDSNRRPRSRKCSRTRPFRRCAAPAVSPTRTPARRCSADRSS